MADPTKKFDLDGSAGGGKIDLDALPTSHPGNVVPKPTEQGSKHPTAAALVRTGAALGSSLGNWEPGLGTAVAAGVGGAGESIAEMLDAGSLDPSVIDPKRVAMESVLSAIPGKAYFKVGNAARSALKSGAIAGAGEYAREKVKGEDVNIKSVARATGLGAVTGGIFGRFLPGAPEAAAGAGAAPIVAGARPKIADLAAQHADDVEAFGKAAGAASQGMTMDEIAREAAALPKAHANALRDEALKANGQWRGPALEKEIARLELLGQHEDAQHMRLASGRTNAGTTKIYARGRDVEQRLAKQQRVAEAARVQAETVAGRAEEARTRMETLAQSGKAKQTAQQTLRAIDPETGEIVSHTVRVSEKPPKEGKISGGGAEPPVIPGMPPIDPDAALKAEVQRVLAKNATEGAGRLPVPPGVAGTGLPERPVGATEAPGATIAAPPEVAPQAPPALPVAPPVAPEPPKALVPEVLPAEGAPTPPPVQAQPAVVPPVAPEPPAPLVSQGVPMATPKRGSPGEQNITDMLTGPEKAAAANEVLRANYPPELADKIVPLSEKYHALTDQIAKLPKDSQNYAATLAQLKRQKGMLGMEMKLLTQQAEEAGVIAAGHGEATSQQIKDAITLANENKFGSQTGSITAPEVLGRAPVAGPETGPIFAMEPPVEGPLPKAGSAVGMPEGVNLEPNLENAVQSATDRAAGGLTKLPEGDGGGTVLGSGLGGFQQLIEKNPELAKRLGMGAAGAAIGGATDPMDDPVLSMAMGAGVGAMAPDILGSLKSAGIKPSEVPEVAKVISSGSPEEKKSLGVQIVHLLPHLQRFNYLSSAPGLAANAFAGPYGALFFGSLERALARDARGSAALREASPLNWLKEFKAGRSEALRRIEQAEAGDPVIRAEMGGSSSDLLRWPFNRVLQAPATAMMSGDVASQTILRRAGFNEEEARDMTATATKMFIPTLRKLGNLARGEQATFLSMIYPFVRTPLNLIEQGLIRTPGIGFGVQALRESKGALQTSKRLKITQQVIGGLMGFGGYALGSMVPKDQASTVRRFATNAAGPYSAIVGVGFEMGQRSRGGVEPGVIPFLESVDRTLPLPTMQTITDVTKSLGKFKSGDVSDVSDLPRGAIPAVLREPAPWGFGPESPSPAMKKLNAKMKSAGTVKKSAMQKKFDLETQ